MPVLRFKATKMTSPVAEKISLVERGANRIPFKIMKQEDEMKVFDLGSIFTRKSEKATPEVVGVVTMKGDNYDAAKEAVLAAGFDVEAVEEFEDGSVVFKQGDMDGEVTVVRLNDDIALVTKGFAPYNMDLATTNGGSFADACKAQGFFPGVDTAMAVLTASIKEVLYSDADKENVTASIEKLFAEAGTYIRSMVAALPKKAFKLEGYTPDLIEKGEEENPDRVEDPVPVAETSQAELDLEGASDEAPADEAPVQVPVAKGAPAEGTAETESEGVKKSETSLTTDDVSAIVSSKVVQELAPITEALKAITDTLSQVQKSVQGYGETFTTIQERLDDAEKVAKSAQEAVSGVVIGGISGDDSTSVRKSETRVMGEIDTAFQPRVRSRK